MIKLKILGINDVFSLKSEVDVGSQLIIGTPTATALDCKLWVLKYHKQLLYRRRRNTSLLYWKYARKIRDVQLRKEATKLESKKGGRLGKQQERIKDQTKIA
eukprot:10889177-Ditylum_brightwellii.AAC.1